VIHRDPLFFAQSVALIVRILYLHASLRHCFSRKRIVRELDNVSAIFDNLSSLDPWQIPRDKVIISLHGSLSKLKEQNVYQGKKFEVKRIIKLVIQRLEFTRRNSPPHIIFTEYFFRSLDHDHFLLGLSAALKSTMEHGE
jgi:serine/threonine-protein kinase RIO1